MQQLYAWSALARPLSFRLLPHRILLICTGLAFLLSCSLHLVYAAFEVQEAVFVGIRLGLAVFLSWALARELYPDAPWAAFAAVAVSSLGLLLWPWPDLGVLFFTLLTTRVINRTSGLPARPLDVVVLLIITAWLLYRGELMAGMLAAAAFWSNSRLPEPQLQHKYLILPVVIATAWAIAYQPHLAAPGALSVDRTIVIIALASGFAFFLRTYKQTSSVADANGKPLSLKRVRSAQVITLLAASIFSLWYGDYFFETISPLWAAFAGIFLYAAFSRTPPKK